MPAPIPLSGVKDNKTGCLICVSHKPNRYGYPAIVRNYRNYNASRYVYEQAYGEIPEGYVVRHKCDIRMCIELSHLELGTQAQNMEDMVERKRSCKGAKNPNVRLTSRQVKEILDSDEYQYVLAKRYKVHQSTIHKIKSKKIWNDIPQVSKE